MCARVRCLTGPLDSVGRGGERGAACAPGSGAWVPRVDRCTANGGTPEQRGLRVGLYINTAGAGGSDATTVMYPLVCGPCYELSLTFLVVRTGSPVSTGRWKRLLMQLYKPSTYANPAEPGRARLSARAVRVPVSTCASVRVRVPRLWWWPRVAYCPGQPPLSQPQNAACTPALHSTKQDRCAWHAACYSRTHTRHPASIALFAACMHAC